MQEVEDMLQHPLSEEELKKAIEKHLGFEMPDKNWDETAEDLFLLIFIEGVASFFVAVAVAFVSSV